MTDRYNPYCVTCSLFVVVVVYLDRQGVKTSSSQRSQASSEKKSMCAHKNSKTKFVCIRKEALVKG